MLIKYLRCVSGERSRVRRDVGDPRKLAYNCWVYGHSKYQWERFMFPQEDIETSYFSLNISSKTGNDIFCSKSNPFLDYLLSIVVEIEVYSLLVVTQLRFILESLWWSILEM